jgi:hypothetical protein
MSWISITHAHEYWRLTRRQADPPHNLEEAEAFILEAHPNTQQDAACILDVVRFYAGDPRCDGLDHAALGRVRDYLSAAD